jgi:hypothetical protein
MEVGEENVAALSHFIGLCKGQKSPGRNEIDPRKRDNWSLILHYCLRLY